MRQEIFDKLENWAESVVRKAVTSKLGICDINRNKVFIKGALRSGFSDLVLQILEESLRTWDSFEYVIIQVATTHKL